MPVAKSPKTIKPAHKPVNRTASFGEVLKPALPVAPAVNESLLANSRIMLPAALVLTSVLTGILAGLVIRESLPTPTAAVIAGPVAVDQTPQYTRILQAQTIAASGVQTIQVTPDSTVLQATGSVGLGSSANLAQPGLSAYDAQGSVGIPSTR
jgi:hypothetical protein